MFSSKWPRNPTFFSPKLKKSMIRKSRIVFIDNTSIETQTVYFENGKIKVSPWKLEENHHIVADGNFVSQKGRMVTEDDGTSVFRPYAVGSGSRYKTIFCTGHGMMKETKNDIIVQLHLPKRLGKAMIKALLMEEVEEMCAFIKTRRTKTFWAL